MVENLSPNQMAGLLCRPKLKLVDVMKIEGVGRDRAGQIMRICRTQFEGEVPYDSHCITTESLLRYNGYEKGTWLELLSKFSRKEEETDERR